MGITEVVGSSILSIYQWIVYPLPPFAQKFLNLFFLVMLVVLYSVFIWKFYRFISTKNILELNLNKYNKSSHPLSVKLLAGIFFLIEYILILPFLIFFWFSVFTLFLIFLTENLTVNALLIISATVIASIRMISYYSEELARDVAKLLPFTLLAVSILNPRFFNIERIIGNFAELPQFFSEIAIYLAFIIFLETIMRIFDFIFSFLNIYESEAIKTPANNEPSSDLH